MASNEGKSFINSYKVLDDPLLTDRIKESKIIYISGYKGQDVLVVTNDDKVYSYSSNSSGSGGSVGAHYGECKELTELSNKCVTKFDSGFNNTYLMALTKAGRLYGWGNNNYGQLGLGRDVEVCDKPTRIEFTDDKRVIDVMCGGFHTIVLTKDREVYAFGYNVNGQLGNNSTENQWTPAKLPFTENKNIVSIACGLHHSIALSESGFAYGCGSNKSSQLGVAVTDRNECNYLSPISIQLPKSEKIDKISCGPHFSVFLSKGGELYRTSKTGIFKEFLIQSKIYAKNLSTIKQLSKTVKFKDIATSHSNALSVALSRDGQCYVWGNKRRKQLMKTEFASMHETFAKYSKHQITYDSIDVYSELVLTQQNKYNKEFTGEKLLGMGGFGTVFKAQCKQTNKIFAIKKIPMCKRDIVKVSQELRLLNKTKSAYVVDCVASWTEDNYYIGTYGKEESEVSSTSIVYNPNCKILLHIQMQFCELTLKDVITKIQSSTNNKQKNFLSVLYYYIASELFKETLESVNYLHSQNPPIIHRDLKPANILLSSGAIDGRFVKLADFGLATVHDFEEQSHTENVGTFKYCAPEVSETRRYDVRADMFSLGKIMAELLNISINNKQNDLCPNLLKSKYNIAIQLVKRLLSDQNERPLCQYVMNVDRDWMLSIDNVIEENVPEFMEIANKTPKAGSMTDNFEEYFIQKKYEKRLILMN